MSKHYVPLISLLSILAFLVVAVAFYKSLSTPEKKPAEISLVSLAPKKISTPTASPSGQIAGTTSAELALEILAPPKNASVSSSLLTISGQTATTAGLTVNDKTVLVDNNGSFRTLLRLISGPNLVVITASSAGQSKVWQTVVTYTAPTPTNVPKTD